DLKNQIRLIYINLNRFEEDNRHLRRTLEARSSTEGVPTDFDGDVDALQQQIRDLRDTMNSLQEKNNELYKVNHEWSEQYKDVRKAMTDRIKTLEAEKEALTKQIAKLDSENQEQETSIENAMRK
ncbi:hypothetical protein, partial [Salmonella sp. s51228]|uniref:hypothetical protein n=1 Tax=Salmonella sp. s51228 TaxID=3159652 RepID=UPI003980F441